MAADAKEAVEALEDVGSVQVTLVDHQLSEEINEGLAHGRGFDEIFPSDTEGTGLIELRARFDSKAFIARQQGLYKALIEAGATSGSCAGSGSLSCPTTRTRPGISIERQFGHRRLRLGTVPRQRRRDADPRGRTRPAHALRPHGERDIEGNASFCRGLLATRYGLEPTAEVRT